MEGVNNVLLAQTAESPLEKTENIFSSTENVAYILGIK